MKFALIVCAILAFTQGLNAQLNEEQSERLGTHTKECLEQEKPSEESLQHLRAGTFDFEDQKLKCFSKCVFEKSGFFANGSAQEAGLKAGLVPIFGEELVAETGAKCNSLKGTDDCDTALKIYKCYHDNKAALQF